MKIPLALIVLLMPVLAFGGEITTQMLDTNQFKLTPSFPTLVQLVNTNGGGGGNGVPITNGVNTSVRYVTGTNYVDVTNIPGNIVSGMVASSTNANVVQGVTIEQFGGIGDGNVVYDAAMTSGSHTVTSLSSVFKATDVGKWMCVYTNLSNTNWFLSLITTYNSPTSVEVSNTAPVTVSGVEARWGSDNATQIKVATDWCIANRVHNLAFTNGTYFIVGSWSLTGSNRYAQNTPIYSAINIGNGDLHNYASTNTPFNLVLQGAVSPILAPNGYFGNTKIGISGEASTLFCPAIGVHNGNDYVFSMSSTNGDFSMLGVAFEKLLFLTPNWRKISWIDNAYGGAFLCDSFEMIGDWNGFVNAGLNSIENYNDTNTFDIYTAVNGNNGYQNVNNFEMGGGYNGIYCGDQASIQNGKIYFTEDAVVIGNAQGTQLHQLLLDVNLTNIEYGYDLGGGSQFYGDVTLGNDDTNSYHGSIWTPGATYSPNASLVVHMANAATFNLNVAGCNFTNSPYINIFLVGQDFNQTGTPGTMNTLSNYYGATLSQTHFPYGAQSAQWTYNGSSWSPNFAVPFLFGGFHDITGLQGIYGVGSPINQHIWDFAAGGILFRDAATDTPRVTIDTAGDLVNNGVHTSGGGYLGVTNTTAGYLAFVPARVPPLTNAIVYFPVWETNGSPLLPLGMWVSTNGFAGAGANFIYLRSGASSWSPTP